MMHQEFINYAKEKGFTNIQIVEETNHEIEASYIDEKLEENNSSFLTGYSIKAEKNNKTVKIKTDYLEKNIIDLLEQKIENEDSSYQDDYLKDLTNNNNENIEKVDIRNEINNLKTIYKLKENNNVKSIITNYYGGSSKKRIINSNGVDMSTTKKVYSYYTEVILEENGKTISHSTEALNTNKEKIDMEKITKNVIEEAQKMLNKDSIPTGKYKIVLSNSVAGSILSQIISGIYANAIRKKTSFFVDKLDKKNFNSKINIIEDPRNKDYPGFTLFDDDGVQTKKKQIIENGILKTFLYNIKEAKLAKTKSTGNSFGEIGTRNLYLEPGKSDKEKLLLNMKDGLYITDYMGSANTAIDISTGNISIQIFGLIIENGKIKCGFEPCVLTTTFEELFNNIEEIGNDLEFFSSKAASPSLYIKNISITGK